MPKKFHLAFDISYTHLDGRWRMPGSWTGRTYPDVGIYEELARISERGCIDMLFFGDGTGIPDTWAGRSDEAVRWGIGWPRHDMSPIITCMSRITKHVGFGLTYASTFMHPFYVARLFNSLDHVTNGRIAFNVIASSRNADAANYGFDELMEHGTRYNRMEEFIDVCRALWDSVEPDAFQWDRESGIVADPEKVRAINHAGKFFKVRGPLNCMPSPQRHPVLIQAGASPRGIRASAHIADHVFARWPSKEGKAAHRSQLDKALTANGRDPEQVGVLRGGWANCGRDQGRGRGEARAALDHDSSGGGRTVPVAQRGLRFFDTAGKILARGAQREDRRQERLAGRLCVQAREYGWPKRRDFTQGFLRIRTAYGN